MGKATMIVLLFMLHPGLSASSTSAPEESQTLDEYVTLVKELFEGLIISKRNSKMDHVAELRKIADRSDELASKAAKAAVFSARGIYDTEPTEREALLEPLQTVFEQSAAYESGVGFRGWGTAFDELDTKRFLESTQDWIDGLYEDLTDVVSAASWESSTNDSANMWLIEFCAAPDRLDVALCILQAYGSIFGSNCSLAYSSSCEDYLRNARSSIKECSNEQIARLSNNETSLNRLAMHAKRNVFLVFNLIAFCSALNESYEGFTRDAAHHLRPTADGFALSKQGIELRSWPRLAHAMSAKILASGSFEQALDETDESYNQTASAIVGKLRYTWPSHGYSAVVYYAYTGPLKSDFVFYNGSVEDSFGVSANGTKAFVKRYKNEDANRLTDQWKSVKLEPETLAKLFEADGPSTSMAERFRKAKLDAKLLREGGFHAAAVIPCAYRFIWYELAWQYFHAYGTTSEYVLTFRGKNAYKPCGAVVLFP